MKSSISLRAAVASALALAGANAMALAPSDIDSTVVKLYVSGATASDNGFEHLSKLSSGELCQAGSLDIYYGPKTKVMFCTAGFSTTGTGTNITAGQTKIAVFKESNGGSANGVSFVARSTTVISGVGTMSFIDLSTTAADTLSAQCAPTLVTASGDFAQYNARTCGSAPLVAVVPDAGISDIDPATFVSVGGVSSGIIASDVAALTHKRQAIAVTFNPMVSTTLFAALQTAQGLSSGNTSSLDQMPSLSSAQIRGIYAGNITDGTKIYTNSTALATLSDNQIYVCRRGNVSGTMASFKLHYLNEGCNKIASTTFSFVTPTGAGLTNNCEGAGCTWGATYATDRVFAGSGSADVRKCVSAHSSLGHYAIGVASTESLPVAGSSDAEKSFRYIKVDGQEPTIKAVMEGRYDFFTENSWNDKLATTNVKYKIFNQIYTKIGTSAVLAKVNEAWRNGAAISGAYTGGADVGLLDLPNVLTSYGPTFPVTEANARSTPINSQTRTIPGGSANNCNRASSVFPL